MKTMNKSTLALAAVAAFVLPSALAQTASDADAGSATGGNDILALLSDPVYALFINIVLTDAPMCITDKAIIDGSFDLGKCPEIGVILEATQAAEAGNAEDPTVTCSASCVSLLNTLGESCRNALLKGITSSDNEFISKYGQEFFNTCPGIEGTPTAPVPSSAVPVVEKPVDVPVDVPVEKPVEMPVEKPVEMPTEVPNLPSSGVSNVAIVAPVILGVLAMI